VCVRCPVCRRAKAPRLSLELWASFGQSMARSRYWRGGWGSLKAPPRPPKLNTRDAMDFYDTGMQKNPCQTCQKPLHRAIERDESLVRQWLEKKYPKILAMVKIQGMDIYFGDAARIHSWRRRHRQAKQGARPCSVDRSRFSRTARSKSRVRRGSRAHEIHRHARTG
jgi:hypothetical protein